MVNSCFHLVPCTCFIRYRITLLLDSLISFLNWYGSGSFLFVSVILLSHLRKTNNINSCMLFRLRNGMSISYVEENKMWQIADSTLTQWHHILCLVENKPNQHKSIHFTKCQYGAKIIIYQFWKFSLYRQMHCGLHLLKRYKNKVLNGLKMLKI